VSPYDLAILQKQAAYEGFNLGHAEKDYVLSVALVALSEHCDALVFKGGTCLKKVYFPGFRFSADLDFTGTVGDHVQMKAQLTALFQQRDWHGVNFLKVRDVSEPGGVNLNLRVQYASRLSDHSHTDSIYLDVNYGTQVLLAPEIRRLELPSVYGLPETRHRVLQLPEILAEKVHAIRRRPKPRDLYDLHFLLGQGVTIDRGLVDGKLRTLDRQFDPAVFRARVERLETGWERDMGSLLADPPAFRRESLAVLERMGVAP